MKKGHQSWGDVPKYRLYGFVKFWGEITIVVKDASRRTAAMRGHAFGLLVLPVCIYLVF